MYYWSSVCVHVNVCSAHTCGKERRQWPEILYLHFWPLYRSAYLVLCCCLAVCVTLTSPCLSVLFPSSPHPVPLLSYRSDHLGADDIRRQAIRRHPHARNPRHSGERGASAPATHLHNRCLHGHGQMWGNTLTKAQSHIHTVHSQTRWVCKICFIRWQSGIHLLIELSARRQINTFPKTSNCSFNWEKDL